MRSDHTGFHRSAAPAGFHVLQHQRRREQLRCPMNKLSLLIFDVEINLRVRIHKIPLRDRPGDRNRFIQLVRNVASVMGESKTSRSKYRGDRRKIVNAPLSHTGSV